MRTAGTMATVLGLAALLGGCVAQSKFDQLNNQVVPLKDQVKQLQEKNDELATLNKQQAQQIESLEALGPRRLALIPHVERIELGSYTGGFNPDTTQKFQNSVKVYLLPIDQDGSVIKAAGSVTVQMYDLAEPKDSFLGECKFTPEEVAKNWFSGVMMTYHYSLVCPWQRPPRHSDVTVRVEFVDYITGKHFTTQQVVKVTPPPVKQ